MRVFVLSFMIVVFLGNTGELWAGAEEDAASEGMRLSRDMNGLLSELQEARQKGEAGRARALETVFNQTSQRVDEIAQGLKMQGRHREASSIKATVKQATSRHRSVLENVRGQVPEQARGGIEQALQSAQRGNETVTQVRSGRLPDTSPPDEAGSRAGGWFSDTLNGGFSGAKRSGPRKDGPSSFTGGGQRSQRRGGRPF